MIDETLARIEAILPGVTVFDSVAPNNVEEIPERYVVVYPETPRAVTGDVASTPNGDDFAFQVTCCASGTDTVKDLGWTARWMAKKIRDSLTGSRPTPHAGKYRHLTSSTSGRDELIVSRTVVATMDRYRAIR